MSATDQSIRENALLRLAGIFKVPLETLTAEKRFGEDLKASFVSDFRRNEFDQVSDDIHDVADRAITKELGSGRTIIKTVGEYCDFMVRCSKIKPHRVERLLGITRE